MSNYCRYKIESSFLKYLQQFKNEDSKATLCPQSMFTCIAYISQTGYAYARWRVGKERPQITWQKSCIPRWMTRETRRSPRPLLRKHCSSGSKCKVSVSLHLIDHCAPNRKLGACVAWVGCIFFHNYIASLFLHLRMIRYIKIVTALWILPSSLSTSSSSSHVLPWKYVFINLH
jgi:hypothetical protein